jgi:hypothetical protein
MNPPRKAGWIALLLPCALIIGLLSGMLLGSRFIPKDAGFAAGATVLFYGMIGGVLGIVVTAILARRMPAPTLRITSLVAVALAILLIALVAWRAMERKRRMDARSRIAATGLPTQVGTTQIGSDTRKTEERAVSC